MTASLSARGIAIHNSRQKTISARVSRYTHRNSLSYGPQLAKTTGGNGWVKMLRQSELKLYQWMASYLPVLLIRLSIDEQTAFLRKPDHQLAALREKIAVTPQLTFNGATILELDGRQPADEILQASLRSIQSVLS